MSSDDSEFESTSTRARKRMLPSVAEIARELSRKTAADAASILTTSRKVCAEELVRIKEGHESVPVDVLVERARVLLEQNSQSAVGTITVEPPPSLPVAPSTPAAQLPEGADPFDETSGKLDLGWEGHAVEPPRDQGDGHEIPPEPEPPSFDTSFLLPDPLPGSEPHAEQKPAPPPPARAPVRAPSWIPLQPPPRGRSRLSLFLVITFLVAVAGGAAWYFLSGLSKPVGPPPSLAVKRKPRAVPAEAATPAVAPSEAQAAPTAPATPAFPATPTWVKSGDVPAAPSGIPAPPTAVPSRKAPSADEPKAGVKAQPLPATKIPAVNVAPEPVPVEPKAKSGQVAPVVPAPSAANAVNVSKPSAEKAAVQASPKRVERVAPSATQEQARAGALVTSDWTGAPVHVVHFSSFVEKARAERHAAVLAKELGLPARAVQVDLGGKGLWYRTVVGEFATAGEALAFRNQLLEMGTPGVGLVYRMTQKK